MKHFQKKILNHLMFRVNLKLIRWYPLYYKKNIIKINLIFVLLFFSYNERHPTNDLIFKLKINTIPTNISKQNIEIRPRSWWIKCLNYKIPPSHPPKILWSWSVIRFWWHFVWNRFIWMLVENWCENEYVCK